MHHICKREPKAHLCLLTRTKYTYWSPFCTQKLAYIFDARSNLPPINFAVPNQIKLTVSYTNRSNLFIVIFSKRYRLLWGLPRSPGDNIFLAPICNVKQLSYWWKKGLNCKLVWFAIQKKGEKFVCETCSFPREQHAWSNLQFTTFSWPHCYCCCCCCCGSHGFVCIHSNGYYP